MKSTKLAKRPSSLGAATQNADPTPLLWHLVHLSDRILFISGVSAATVPLSYYLFCYYYRQTGKATCRQRNSDLIIILGSIFILMYLVNGALHYLARRRAQRANQ
ncbi:hypothetical protein BDV24DRAFT_140240 [Aspergillus arachidicola]|uniref:Uncharacterized protein n=1 Tax=Aspergillus arachidicola TaxID=656916 RepID=A0A5N6XVX1_9EURO|nr:hypothetical protein BDV24DRAFT_140240 [Aspergillus arachidicola]